MSDRNRYTADIDLRNVNDSHAFAVASVPARSTVLDVGAADGSVARVLSQMGCQVWGIELDPGSAEEAQKWCEHVVVGDVEELDLKAALDHTFDVILFLDILEHLRDPLSVLRNSLDLLDDRGYVVISLPNVAHAAMRAQLLTGRFAYTDTGLLDRTHLRFFDPVSVREFLFDAGLVILDESEVTFPLGGTEIPVVSEDLSEELLAQLDKEPGADTYQFLFIAAPAGSATAEDPPFLPARVLQRALRDSLSQMEQMEQMEQMGRQGDTVMRSDVLTELTALRAQSDQRRGVLRELLECSRRNTDRLVNELK